MNIQICFKSGNISKLKVPDESFEKFAQEFLKGTESAKWLLFENILFDTDSIESISEIEE